MRALELYKYNPDQMTGDELQATFTVRKGILDSILDELRVRAKSKVNQHFLITGPRGIGKTNLLLMLRQRIQGDRTLSRAYLPLKTAEEEYAITSLRDLFVKILQLLVEADCNSNLEERYNSISKMPDDEEAAEACITSLKDYCKRHQLKIVLLLDNIDLILDEQLTEKHEIGRLRDVLMNESFLVLIGAAPTFFKEVSGYGKPLYNFFKLLELEDLSFDGTVELLKRRAKWDENKEMLDRLEEIQPRLEALYHLTGGNPRLLLMLYQLYTQTELPEVKASLEMLLDDLTPYYKHRMEKLPPQQRKVLDSFARLGHPASPTELSKETRLPVNQINSILKRLRENGFVSVAPQKRRKVTLYMVSERVFRIWHQMRFSTQSRRRLEFLIEFIRIWYTASEWAREVARLREKYRSIRMEKSSEHPERYIEHLQYMAEAAPEVERGYQVEDVIVGDCIEMGDYGKAGEILDQRIDLYTRQKDKERLAQTWFLRAYLMASQENRHDEIAALEKAISCKADFPDAIFTLGVALSNLAETKTGKAQEALFKQAFDKYEAALKIKPDMHEALNNWGNALSSLAEKKKGDEQKHIFVDALDKVDLAIQLSESLEKSPDTAFYSAHFIHISLALTSLEIERDNRGEALKFFERALDRFPNAEPELAREEIAAFFRRSLDERTAEICGDLLGLMDNRKMVDELALLSPFASAIEYWQKGKDEEVLDRLNPEVRQLVEKILSGKTEK
jgi:tetratricopeptide (TPR) repeat protein